MKIGTLINARLGSKRLPQKHLRDIQGKLAIDRLLDRLEPQPDVQIIIATGTEHENKQLAPIAKARGIEIFFGDANNIPNRHKQIGEKYDLDAIISIDADDVLVSPEAYRCAIAALKSGKELVRTKGLPLGMNILWAYSIGMLVNALANAKGNGSMDTGWGWIFPEPAYFEFVIPNIEKIRLTLDYPEDLKCFRAVYQLCPKDKLDDDAALCDWMIANRIHNINKYRHNIA